MTPRQADIVSDDASALVLECKRYEATLTVA